MSSPTQLNIVVSTSNGATVTTSTVNVSIPAALQSLDATSQGATPTGYSAVDQLVRAIFRAGCFTDGKGNWWNANAIQTITAQ